MDVGELRRVRNLGEKTVWAREKPGRREASKGHKDVRNTPRLLLSELAWSGLGAGDQQLTRKQRNRNQTVLRQMPLMWFDSLGGYWT